MIVIVIIIDKHHYSHMTLTQSTETAHHSVQARMCALQSWRLDLLACNKGKWTANKGITTLKRPANLFPSPNIPPRHLPDCLGHTWLQNKPTPMYFPSTQVLSLAGTIYYHSSPPKDAHVRCHHAHAHAVQTSVNYTTVGFKPHSGCDVIPDVTLNLIKAQTTPLLPAGHVTSLPPFPDVPSVLIWPQKPRLLPAGSITSLSPFPDVPVVPIWPQKPRPLPAGSITSLSPFPDVPIRRPQTSPLPQPDV